jgi:hypothetical protein
LLTVYFWDKRMAETRKKRERWVQRGDFAVEVEVEVVFPTDDPSEACLEPATIRWLDEVARKAEQGDIKFLRRAGGLFQAVPS